MYGWGAFNSINQAFRAIALGTLALGRVLRENSEITTIPSIVEGLFGCLTNNTLTTFFEGVNSTQHNLFYIN